jgi:hypothetical protein
VDTERERTVDRETRGYADNIDGPGDAPLPDDDVGYESEEVLPTMAASMKTATFCLIATKVAMLD